MSLRETLSGSIGSGASNAALLTTRREKMAEAWQDLVVQVEALWSDILDVEEPLYDEALPLLGDIRGASPEGIRGASSSLEGLRDLIARRSKGEDDDDRKDIRLYLARMEQLLEEYRYLVDEFDPEVPRPPGAPVRDRESWERDQKIRNRTDLVYTPAPAPSSKKKKVAQEAIEKASPRLPSLVLTSFIKASELRTDDGYLLAAESMKEALLDQTDVSGAHVEFGNVIPGSFPRVDLYCEWSLPDGRPSDSLGYARLWFSEDGLVILDEDDAPIDRIPFSSTDEDLSRRIYESLSVSCLPSPERIFDSARIVPALYRLLERAGRGEDVPPSSFEGVLTFLRPRIGLHESVFLIADDIHLVERSGLGGIYRYHYTWATRTPLTHLSLPDELSPETASMLEPVPQDILSDTEEDRKRGEQALYHESGTLSLDLREGKVKVGDEDVPPETTDEDLTARLLSLSRQRESTHTGRIIEGIQDQSILKAILLAGGGGSGKSFVAQQAFGRPTASLATSLGVRFTDSDHVLTTLTSRPGLRQKMSGISHLRPGGTYDLGKPEDMGSVDVQKGIRPKAKVLHQKMLDIQARERLSLIVDGTGRRADKLIRTKKELEKLGYDTYLLFVTVDVETALKRNAARGRQVPSEIIRKAHAEINANRETFRREFGENFYEVRNEDADDFSSYQRFLRQLGRKILSEPIRNPRGRAWIEDQLSARNITRWDPVRRPIPTKGFQGKGSFSRLPRSSDPWRGVSESTVSDLIQRVLKKFPNAEIDTSGEWMDRYLPRIGVRLEEAGRLARADFRKECDRRRAEKLTIDVGYANRKEAKKRGGIWDSYGRVWLMPDRKSIEEIQSVLRAKKVGKREDTEDRYRKGYWIPLRYEDRHAAKDLGGVWDGSRKLWLLPDEESLKALKKKVGYQFRRIRLRRAEEEGWKEEESP
jgi:predicted kinase